MNFDSMGLPATCAHGFQDGLESKSTPVRARARLGFSGFRKLLLTAAALGLLAPGVLWADTPGDDSPDVTQGGDSRAVRLSSVEGQVRVVQDGQIIADPAYNNLPLFQGSQVSTGNDGRAEIQLENGSFVRLSPNSSLTFTVLKQQGTGSHTEVVLNGGLAYFELQPSNSEHSLRVSYGPASFSATSFTVARVTMDQQPGELAVFSGNVHLDRGDQLQLDVHGGESLSLNLGDGTQYNLAETIQPDSWDSWNADRDQAMNAESADRTAASSAFTDSQGLGMTDLDANGNWYNVPGQGYVWSPYDAQAVGASFDPYGFGHWVFYPRYGYVWVSGYDWGYAPFQCGLWNFYDDFGWGWAPGGGCNPWWGFGGGGWGYNIGRGPHGYLPPRRPFRGPANPHPLGGHELRAANVVAVDRRPASAVNMALYAHPSQPVTIAGHTVEPLRPVAPRQGYEHPGTAYGYRPGSGYYPSPSHPGYVPGNGYAGQTSGSRPATSYSAPTHSAPAAASHPSYSGGGGGGGGGHPSGGGGGGGGGGTHK